MAYAETIHLPCFIDDIVYVVLEDITLPGRRRVTNINISGINDIVFTVRNDRTGETSKYRSEQFGVDIFADRASAEQASRKAKAERNNRQE